MERIRVLKKEDYDQLYRLRRVCFDMLTEDHEKFCRDYYYDEENWVGLFIDEKLVSVVWVKPLLLNLNGKTVKAGGLGSVATLPDYRYKGYSRQLIDLSLKEMKDKGYVLSSLAPFLQRFYEKFGYVHSFDFKELVYSMNKICHLSKKTTTEEVTENDRSRLVTARERFVSRYQLMGKRDESLFRQYLKVYEVKGYQIRRTKDEGYVVFKEYPDMVKVIELVYANSLVMADLLAYIYNVYKDKEKLVIISPDDNIIKDYVNTPPDEEKVIYGKMTKVIDVKRILELSELKENLVVKVENETYEIRDKQVIETEKAPDAEFSIRSFTQYILGIREMDELVFLGKAKMNKKLEMTITHKTIYENEGY